MQDTTAPKIKKPIESIIENKKSLTLYEEIKIAFYKLGPKETLLDIRQVVKDKWYRLNWWAKKLNGDCSIVFSIFITVVKTPGGYDFINETATDIDRIPPKTGEKL